MASKQARAREFSSKEREKIKRRDQICIFCKLRYHTEHVTWYAQRLTSIMHYIPRSKGGLGIEQNGALGCQVHHDMLDNGHQGRREEMLAIFKKYLQGYYPDWNEDNLIYKKY